MGDGRWEMGDGRGGGGGGGGGGGWRGRERRGERKKGIAGEGRHTRQVQKQIILQANVRKEGHHRSYVAALIVVQHRPRALQSNITSFARRKKRKIKRRRKMHKEKKRKELREIPCR